MIHANQVRSLFLEGLDSKDIAARLGITEAEAVRLNEEARHTGFRVNHTEDAKELGRRRGSRAAQANRRNVPVSLPKVRGVS